MRPLSWSGRGVLAGVLLLAPAEIPASERPVLPTTGVPARTAGGIGLAESVVLPFPGIEPNRGQADPAARFVARVPGMTAFLSATDAWLLVGRPRTPEILRAAHPNSLRRAAGPDPVLLRLRFPGASPGASLEPADPLPGPCHYLLGDDPSAWTRDVPRFGRLRVRGVWAGVDLEYAADRAGLEYRFLLAPGADPSAIGLAVEGGGRTSVAADGSLVVETPGGSVRHSAPVLWQERGGRRLPVSGRFEVGPGGTVGFRVGSRDPGLPLVIDPTLTFASYLGGSGADFGFAIAVDSSGAMYVTGSTASTNFRLSSAMQGSNGGGSSDAFVTKVNSSGTSLAYSTYLGGAGFDAGNSIDVDGSGAAYVAGVTGSSAFPRQGAFQNAYGGGTYDGFLSKLAANGASFAFSTYLGGYGSDSCYALDVDGNGSAYVTGWTASTNFPLASAMQGTKYGLYDGFVTKFNAQGSSLLYSTFLGGDGDNDSPGGIRVDSSGVAAVAGLTNSQNFPTFNARQTLYSGGDGPSPNDAFACRILDGGGGFVYSTYVGGSGYDDCTAMDVDASGSLFLCGFTDSSDFPTRNNFQLNNKVSPHDAYLLKLRPTGSLDYGTYLGGNGYDEPYGVAVTANGSVFLCGLSSSTDFPRANPLQNNYGGGTFDAFISFFHPTGAALFYSTYVGTTYDELFYGVAVGASGTPHFAGATSSSSFQVQSAFQSNFAGGNWDAIVLRHTLTPPTAPSGLTATAPSDRQVSLSWSDLSSTETGFDIERRSGSAGFLPLASTGTSISVFTDNLVLPETTYTYRVSARNVDGLSAPSNEASATTPPSPTPPAAPDGVAAVAVSATEIDVSWNDNSDDENTFYLQRRLGNQPAVVARVLPANSTTGRDSGLLPGRTYTYRVRATNSAGSTTSAQEASATTLSTLALTLAKGALSAAGDPGKDKAKVSGVLAVPGSGPLDPEADGFVVGIGSEDDPLLATVGAFEVGWKISRGKYTWKSPKGSSFKAKFSLDTVSGKFSFSVSGLAFPEVPDGDVLLWLRVGSDAAGRTDAWRPGKKAGAFSFRLE